MTSERQFRLRGENPDLARMHRVCRRKNEGRFGKIEFACDRLHAFRGNAGGLWQHRELIAPEGICAEDIDDNELVAHGYSPRREGCLS